MQVVLAVFYVLAGILLAIPYCLLAGWDAESFPMVACVAPVFLLIWFITATFAGIIELGHRRTIHFNWHAIFGKRRAPSGSLPIFWAWTLYSFLPIILHWSATLLGKIGYKTVSSLLNTHRYASLLYVFMATLMLFILIAMVISAWDAAKNVCTRIVHR